MFLGIDDDILQDPKKTWVCESCDTHYFGVSPPDYCYHPNCGCRYFDNKHDLIQAALTGEG